MLELTFTLLFTALFLWIIWTHRFFQLPGISKRWMSGFFIIKVAASFALYLIYTYYYTDRSTADIFKLFDDSAIMYEALFDKPADFFVMLFETTRDEAYFQQHYFSKMMHWNRAIEVNTYNDNHTIIKINAILRIFTFGYYNVAATVITFFSFAGLTAIYKSFQAYFSLPKLTAVILFLLPSGLLWTSGLIKEAFLTAAIGILIWVATSAFSRLKLLFALLCFAFLILSKFYLLACLIPGILGYALTKRFGRPFIMSTSALVGCVLAALALSYIYPDYSPFAIIERKQQDYLGHVRAKKAGSAFDVTDLEPTFSSLMINAPEAFVNGMLRPFPTQAKNPFALLNVLETAFLLLLIGLTIGYRKKDKYWPLILFGLTFSILLLLLIGWTTPVAGGIVRYRVPAYLMIICASMIIIDPTKLPLRLQKLLT